MLFQINKLRSFETENEVGNAEEQSIMSANEQMLAEDCRINRCRVMLVYKISRLCPFGNSAAERMLPADLSRLCRSLLWLGLEASPVNCGVGALWNKHEGTELKLSFSEQWLHMCAFLLLLFFNVILSLLIKLTI